MIELQRHAAGTLLPVKAQAGASENAVRGEHNGRLKVSVTQIAEKGKANEALIAVLAKSLKVRKGDIELLSGANSASKTFLIRGCQLEELAARIEAVLARP